MKEGVLRDGGGVGKNRQRIAGIQCTEPAASEIGPDLFEKAGLPEDEGEFDLP